MDKLTTKELIPKLIEHYQFGVDNLPMEDWDEFLLVNNLQTGICNASIRKFKVCLSSAEWLKKLTKKNAYICPIPIWCQREKALEYLQIRLDALKSIDLKTLKDE
jgi:hypothetical protein